jgi:hypothetical protein
MPAPQRPIPRIRIGGGPRQEQVTRAECGKDFGKMLKDALEG